MHASKTYRLVVIGAMAALSSVIYWFLPEIPIVPGVSYLKFDFSIIPAVVTGMLYGPWPGVGVVFLKELIHLLKSDTFGIGELANLFISGSAVLLLYLFYRLASRLLHKETMSAQAYYLAAAVTIVCTIFIGWVVNLALNPIYLTIMGFPVTKPVLVAAVFGSTTLNAVKFAVATLPIYPILVGVQRYFKNT